MLDKLRSEDFAPLIGKNCTFRVLQMPDVELRIQSIREKPLSQVPGREGQYRTPFVVEMVAAGEAQLVDAVGQLSLPQTDSQQQRTLENVWISRTGAMGRDRDFSYFQLTFN
ncbi:hypothetical protein [Chromobacterium sp. IIBBL 290-4]|uniref:hypothetical protein n=1 Tax=Chromobacterium sp. IIBBL 290-4 TaxID=2953890 RepID=UPI0020B656C7|nr:hypothetical protein [Chromobacterium sp. IIBBL 290-4]UTH76154.1 hypothetical protein NKT35_08630 [Chromobacterium sp. IIBBL 290-4]